MSEEERKLRQNYRTVRKKCIVFQTILLVAVIVIALASSVLAMILNKTYYVSYTEKSSVDYGVHLKGNNFYDESFLGKDYAYIASLIDTVEASFKYKVDMQSEEDIDFSYTYRIDSVVQIKEKFSSKVLYAPVYNEVPETSESVIGKGIEISKTAFLDYEKYNKIANSFIDAYNLSNVDAALILKMNVDVKGTSDAFHDNENSNSYVSSISIPLTLDTVEIKITSATPAEEQKILSYTTENIADFFRTIAIGAAIIAALLAAALWAYAYLSRNIDVTYDIKVAKLVRSYKSFIQKIRNKFDVRSYQVLVIDSFNEMLEIRDTIQSPILMEENEDKTCTKFFIPTSTKLLYLFEIKVDDYDEIYGSADSYTDAVSLTPASAYVNYTDDDTSSHSVLCDKISEPNIFVKDENPRRHKIKLRVKVTLNDKKQ